MEARTDSDLRVLSLNVCGVKNKLNYDEFANLINKHDIVGLTETKTDDTDKIEIPGFVTFMKNRKKLTKTRSGGIMLVVKDDFVKYVKIINTDNFDKIYTFCNETLSRQKIPLLISREEFQKQYDTFYPQNMLMFIYFM